MNIVKELRKRAGIQQKELAANVGVSVATVSDWETQKKDPSGARLKKLSQIFGSTAWWTPLPRAAWSSAP